MGNSKGKGGETVNGAIIKHMQTDMTHDLECINQYTQTIYGTGSIYVFRGAL